MNETLLALLFVFGCIVVVLVSDSRIYALFQMRRACKQKKRDFINDAIKQNAHDAFAQYLNSIVDEDHKELHRLFDIFLKNNLSTMSQKGLNKAQIESLLTDIYFNSAEEALFLYCDEKYDKPKAVL